MFYHQKKFQKFSLLTVYFTKSYSRKPKILVLDEATSELDIDNEKSVNAAVSAMGLTRIVVAHRPETIASAGRVLMIKGGMLSEA